MNLYVIEIGGTGHRVTEGLLQLAACGAVPADNLKLMSVDADASNGNLDSLIGAIKLYKKVSKGGTVLKPSLEIADLGQEDKDNPCWSPIAQKQSMKNSLNKMAMDSDAKLVFDSLYTPEEQNTGLERGFYGHTSIGSLLIAEQLRPDGIHLCPEWSNYFDGINQEKDKVILIGSTFGGTGASGIPVISSILRQSYPKLKIGVVLVMPYFKFSKTGTNSNGNQDISIDWTYFVPKTKAALSYYEKQGFDKIFNEIYLIGEAPQNFMDVAYSTGADTQANKPHIIELFAASAVIDFIKSSGNTYSVKVMSRTTGPDGDGNEQYYSDLTMLIDSLGDKSVPYKYAAFMRVCVMYTKYYYHCLKSGKSSGSWISSYKGIDSEELDNFYDLSQSFINWIRKAHLKTDARGKISNAVENSVRFFNFSKDFLFNFAPETGRGSKNDILLKPLNEIADIVMEKPGCNDAQEIDYEFQKCRYNDSRSEMKNLIENLKFACSI